MTGLPAGAPRAVLNPHLDRSTVPAPAGHEVLDFHRRLAGYEPTALHLLADLAAASRRGTVLLKDESSRFGLPAFKILGASWAVERTVRAAPAVATLVTASSGNHGRAVARSAAPGAIAADPRCAQLRSTLGWGRRLRVLCIATEGASDPDGYATVGTGTAEPR